jgi:hypothetical protein
MTAIDDPAIEALTRRFLLGTARNPIPTAPAFHNLISAKEPASELTALALVGQRMRFRRHGPPPEPTAERFAMRASKGRQARQIERMGPQPETVADVG